MAKKDHLRQRSQRQGTRPRIPAVRVTVSFTGARRGTYVVDAAEGDAEVQKLISVGTKQARRGRPRKAQS